MHRVRVHVQRGDDFSVTFSKDEGHRVFGVGPWLVFSSFAGVEEILRRGTPAGGNLAEDIRRWGRGDCLLDLTDEQYIKLLEAGYRDTSNAYQKRKARSAGTISLGRAAER